jgi:hypothetical protein
MRYLTLIGLLLVILAAVFHAAHIAQEMVLLLIIAAVILTIVGTLTGKWQFGETIDFGVGEKMKNIRLPGAVWAGLMVAGAALIHEYTDNPLVYDAVLTLVMWGLKALNISAEGTIGSLLPPGAQGAVRPPDQKKWTRWLVG